MRGSTGGTSRRSAAASRRPASIDEHHSPSAPGRGGNHVSPTCPVLLENVGNLPVPHTPPRSQGNGDCPVSVEGVLRIPLRRFEDERGWFCELRRDSALPRPTVQTNVSFSRRGFIRGLHYH